MPAAAIPTDEARRLAALREYQILDTPPDAALDDLTQQAMKVCGVSVGRISFVDAKREWFKSRFGVAASEAPRDQSFCSHALHTPERPLIVPDATQDARFADNPLVLGDPGYRFYAGFPLRSPEGLGLGTLCVLDNVPRQLSPGQIDKLRALAQQVSVRLSLRRKGSSERLLVWSFGVGLVLLLCLAMFFALQAVRLVASNEGVAHTRQVISEIEHTLFEVQGAESAQRGYTAGGGNRFLEPYKAAIAVLPSHLATLRQATSDNPVQQRNIQKFQADIDVKLAVMQERVEQRRTLGPAALEPRLLDGRGQRSMQNITADGNGMIALENALMDQRMTARIHGLHTTVGMLLGTSGLGATLLAAGFLLTRRELRRSRNLGEAVARANLDLEDEVAERRRAQQRLSVQHEVARIAAQSVSLAQAVPRLLQCIGEHLDWEVGEFWSVDAAANRMRVVGHWHAHDGNPVQAAGNAEFVRESRRWTFAQGEGLPGRVWAHGEPAWDYNLQGNSCFFRSAQAQTAGLHRAFAFPLRTGQDDLVTSAMVFLSKEPGAPDGDLVATMSTLAGQIAQFAERCRAEAGLLASQARFTAFIENAPALAYIKDSAGRMLYGNGTLLRLFNLREEEWLGKTDADFWPDSAPAIRENDLQVLAEEKAIELNEAVPLPDGRMRHWLSYKFPLLEETTGRKLLAGISVDITAREEAEENRRAREEAERASRAKSEFLSRVSHELRTPLNAILGFGQLLQASPHNDQDAEALAYILKAGTHLLGLVDEVLDLSRAESGGLRLTPGQVELADVVQDCLNLTARLAKDRAITCELQGFEEHVSLWCDGKRLRQVLLNLLSNAIKYNHDGGFVFIRYESLPGQKVRLTVRDTGPGLTSTEISRLFVPFERLEQKSGKVDGIGLGLVVSRRLIEAMGGSMGVTSKPGGGCSFWFEVPVGTRPPAQEVEVDIDPDLLAALQS